MTITNINDEDSPNMVRDAQHALDLRGGLNGDTELNTNGAVVEVLNYVSRNPPSSSDPEIQGQSLGLAITASSWNSRMANNTNHGIVGSLDAQAALDAIERILPAHHQQRRLLESPLCHK